jgi:phosphoserine phosphatase RsbU/P
MTFKDAAELREHRGPHTDLELIHPNLILDSLNDGVYVTDTDRRIIYWSKGAERITGWLAADVVGHRCLDNILCHVDKDGHLLCGREHCPLHRSMVTGTTSTIPVIIFAKGKRGERIPLQATVAPIRNPAGDVIGGVETFRDMSDVLADLERARRIQALSLEHDLPDDPRIQFATCYMPHDFVGGDFFAIRKLDEDRYGILLADVMGHGVAAALHTMHLKSLWTRHYPLVMNPADFASAVNRELGEVVKYQSFATAICGVIDAQERTLRLTTAGGPPVLIMRASGAVDELESSGLPLGMLEDTPYAEETAHFDQGDCLLLFSDGAFEIYDAQGRMLGVEGLIRILRSQGYPESGIQMKAIEEELLRYSNVLRLEDDLTFIAVRFSG